jgi:predicted RNase H-like nuclease (RuvC/YqgF family)
MGKVLLYASIAITLAAAAIGFVNKGHLTETKEGLATATQNLEKKSGELTAAQKSLKDAQTSLATVTAEKEQLTTEVAAKSADLEKSKSQVSDLTSQVGTKDTEITTLKADVAAKTAEIETLKTGSTGTAGADTEKDTKIAEQQAQLQELETVKTKMTSELESARAQVEELRKEKATRSAGLMRKGLEGKILAVNQAWNFVVLNLGDRNGVVGNAEMLIKRGNQLVGKVRITSVEPSTSIGDIVPGSVSRGVSIQPGDNVIYQATAE